MTTLEKLQAWAKENGHDGASLSKAMCYYRNNAAKVLDGSRPIGRSFVWRFNRVFGKRLTQEIFGIAFEGASFVERVVMPEQYAAHLTLAKARRRGELPPASAFRCHACDKQANQYHHQSYHPNDHMCLVPLCHTCHGKAHWKSLNVTFGVVPTRYGVLRIAIAGLSPS